MKSRSITIAILAVTVNLSPANRAWADNPLCINVTADRIEIRSSDKTILTYRYGDVSYKPYIERWLTPAGINILRDAPHDHLHHHGIMYALMVDGMDFWGEMNAKNDPPGFEEHRGLTAIEVNSKNSVHRATFIEELDWATALNNRKVLLTEQRRISAYQLPNPSASLITWESQLCLPPGKQAAIITGRSYFGLGIRFIESMDLTGQLFNAGGKTGKDDTNDKQSKWCAYTAEANEKPVTVAIFDHHDNPRHPARWFTMLDPFSYLSATLDVHHQAINLTQGDTLKLRYGLALWDGKVKPEKIEKFYRHWLKLSAATTQPGN